MDRIKGAGNVNNRFVAEDVATSRPPTEITAEWLNGVQEEIATVVEASGQGLDGARNDQLLSAIRQIVASAAAQAAVPTGAVMHVRRLTAPAGWVELREGTIGNAASSATIRAHADTEALFRLIWETSDNAAAPVQNSAGAPVARGASAAADFAAGKRIPLDDMRGEFIRALDGGRGVDVGRVLGSAQADANRGHHHTGGYAGSIVEGRWGSEDTGVASPARYEFGDEPGVPTSVAAKTSESGDTESRPRNRAYLAIIKL